MAYQKGSGSQFPLTLFFQPDHDFRGEVAEENIRIVEIFFKKVSSPEFYVWNRRKRRSRTGPEKGKGRSFDSDDPGLRMESGECDGRPSPAGTEFIKRAGKRVGNERKDFPESPGHGRHRRDSCY